MKQWLFLVAALVVALSAHVGGAAAQPPASGAPDDFIPVLTAPGLHLYEHVDNWEYVQIIDLSAGARLRFLHGAVVEPGEEEGIYGGSSPYLERSFLSTIWSDATATFPNTLCLLNGTYFRDTINGAWVNPTQLAFPLKIDGAVVSEGYERRRFPSQRSMLQLWSDEARIAPLGWYNFYNSDAPDIIAGLSQRARVRPTEELGRTLVGTLDSDGDGARETVLIYSGAAATQYHAMTTLRAFGASELMLLDGGGSTQLMCEGVSYIHRARPLPNTIVTVPGPVQAPAGLEPLYRLPLPFPFWTIFSY